MIRLESEGPALPCAGRPGMPARRKDSMKPDMEAWRDMRFGMFIHWGLYALVGHGEWAMYNDPIDVDEYRRLADRFTAEKFDAAA